MRGKIVLLLAIFALVLATPAFAQEPAGSVPGLDTAGSEDNSVEEVVGAVEEAVEGNEAASVVEVVDHSENASQAGLELPPTQVVLFGNPELGTPLMQANQTAGIDLPQKILAWEDGSGSVTAAYNNAEYLADRHGLGESPELEEVSGTLQMLTENATGGAVESAPGGVNAGEGLVTLRSDSGMEETYDRLIAAIEEQEPLSIVAELDHAENAASVGMELPPTRLVVFGNPEAGTPLMQESQSIGIDLPQKMLIYEDEAGQTSVTYNDPYYLADRHGITGQEEGLEQVSGALQMLSQTAAGEESEAAAGTEATPGELPDSGGLPVWSIATVAGALALGLGAYGLLSLRRRA